MPRPRHLAPLALLLAALLAGQASASLRVLGELGWQGAAARPDTPINPDAELVQAEDSIAGAALNAAGAFQGETTALVLDAWLEQRRDFHSDEWGTRTRVPEAYAEWLPDFETALAAGVTLTRWGTGYVWNPANPLADPEANNTSRARVYRRDGDPFLRLDSLLGRNSLGVQVTRLLQNDPLLSADADRETVGSLRYQHVGDGYDLTGFVAGLQDEWFLGSALSATVGHSLEIHAEAGLRSRRRAPRVVGVPVPDGAGGRTELFVWDFEPRTELTPAALLGAQYTFANLSNVIVEYFYNGNGFSEREYDRLLAASDASRALLSDPALGAAAEGFLLDANRLAGRLRRHYLFLRIARDDLLRDFDLHYFVRLALEDRSTVHGLLLRYALTPRLSLQASAEAFAGGSRDETALIPVRRRGEATLTWHF